jgi:hypothetical protein
MHAGAVVPAEKRLALLDRANGMSAYRRSGRGVMFLRNPEKKT